MKIFFWPASSVDGTFKYRIEMQRDALLERGHEVQCSQTMGMWAREDADLVVGQRVAGPGPLFVWQKIATDRPGLRRVYELDDDLLAINTLNNPLGSALRDQTPRRVMIECIETADLITASTEPLAKSLRKLSRNVVVLPNSLPTTIFDVLPSLRRGRDDGNVVVGWQGSPTHGDDWAMIQPVIADTLSVQPSWETNHPLVWMHFLGTPYGGGLPRHRIRFQSWTTDLHEHYRRVARFDIGLAPLTRSPFNDAKSGIKFMEAAAVGVPMICSRVPAYESLVEHGVTGFLASTPAQWAEYLHALINDAQLRVRIGDAAREAAREWTIDKRIHLWEEAYGSVLP